MNKKIVVIDSGIGGTGLLEALVKKKLAADFYYQADSKNVPYGEKSQEFMLERVRLMLALYPDADAAIIACNTLTAETIEQIRKEYQLPIFGIEPYVNYLNHKGGEKLALILTPATHKSLRFRKLIEKYDPEEKIDIYPLVRLALIIEDYKNIDWGQIKEELSPLRAGKYSHLILGCTHYPLIKDFIEEFLQLKTIDPNELVVSHIEKSLGLDSGQGSCFFRFNIDQGEEVQVQLPLIKYE